jgi:hypothetical protein
VQLSAENAISYSSQIQFEIRMSGRAVDEDQSSLAVLLCGSETWTVRARDARRITAAEMKCMRRTAGYTWTDYKTN